jgi:hypothetical protein
MRLFLPAMQMATNAVNHLGFVGRPALAHRVRLHILVQQLVGVQFRAVSRQANRAQALGVVSHKLRHGTRSMHRMSIDDQVDFAGRLLEQALHEFDEHRVLELPLEDLFVEK